jgi:hypothetical protein
VMGGETLAGYGSASPSAWNLQGSWRVPEPSVVFCRNDPSPTQSISQLLIKNHESSLPRMKRRVSFRELFHLWRTPNSNCFFNSPIALCHGVQTCGKGNWAMIKANSGGRLDNRTSNVDIKNKWRNMSKQKETRSRFY